MCGGKECRIRLGLVGRAGTAVLGIVYGCHMRGEWMAPRGTRSTEGRIVPDPLGRALADAMHCRAASRECESSTAIDRRLVNSCLVEEHNVISMVVVAFARRFHHRVTHHPPAGDQSTTPHSRRRVTLSRPIIRATQLTRHIPLSTRRHVPFAFFSRVVADWVG
ncbi:hypothetical protein P171DRAFT_63611 [Karstenula rhodostoma CBS 690.94]|uniref:Uncharacterized protein n=1 Tax=Karstenula rhodostoma CBS 690.94 TaxID=1392251 RepID=A0A9P4PFZ2_9PLEO|nr:hypothetical protein P171DRAFT_63611 [Karstenula rhodostoma CBS 690.94]